MAKARTRAAEWSTIGRGGDVAEACVGPGQRHSVGGPQLVDTTIAKVRKFAPTPADVKAVRIEPFMRGLNISKERASSAHGPARQRTDDPDAA
jgi:hypothetical protein